jgi:hypothetical protein
MELATEAQKAGSYWVKNLTMREVMLWTTDARERVVHQTCPVCGRPGHIVLQPFVAEPGQILCPVCAASIWTC